MSPTLCTHHAVYDGQVAHWRQLYPDACVDIPAAPASANTTLTERLTIDTELPIDEDEHVEPLKVPTPSPPAVVTQTELQAAPSGTQEPVAHTFQARLADPPADVPLAHVVEQLADGQPAAQAEPQSALAQAQPAAKT
jgi:hypothetical protein